MAEDKDVLFNEQLPVREKVAYGISGASQFLLFNIASSPIVFFYNVKLGLDPALIGIAFLIFLFWNALNDPIFGIMEDRVTSEKYGRRIPYIRFLAPLLCILFILLWLPPKTSDDMVLFYYFLIMLLALDTVFTIMGLAQGALGAEIAFTSKARASVGIYTNLITAIGTGISFVLPLILLTGDESATIHPMLAPAMIILAITASTLIIIATYFIKEKEYLKIEEPLGLIEGIKEAFKNRPWLINSAVGFFYTMSNTIFLTGIYYYMEYIIRLSGFLAVVPLLIVFGMFIIFSIFVQPLIKKHGVKKIIRYFGYGLSSIAFILVFFMGWQPLTALIALIFIGIGMGAVSVLQGVTASDTMDYDEVQTGKRRETVYGGVGAMINKPAISIANWLFLAIIGLYGFVSEKGTPISAQPESAFLGIMVGFTLIPAIFVAIAFIIMRYYPLDGPEWDEEKRKLQKIHEEKEKEYIRTLKEKGII